MKKLKKHKRLSLILDYIMIIIGALFLSVATYMFTIPAKFIPSGVTGIASMLEILSGFHASYTIAIINLPILVLAIKFLDKKFAIRTLVSIIIVTGSLELFNRINLYEFYNNSQPLITAVIAGSMSGLGIGILLRHSSSPGGTEVVSLLIQKKLKDVKVVKILFVLNVSVILIGAVMYALVGKMDIDTILVIAVSSILQGFINSKTIDMIINGLNSAVKFEVITNKGKELSSAINKQLEYGVTIIKSQGAYSEEKNDLLICVVPKSHISTFKSVILQNDPTAFVFSIETREVMGKNFMKKL